jgi:hypothetical protein
MCGLEGLRIGPQLLPGFGVDPDLVERAQKLTPDDARSDLVALAACCLDAGAAELAERLDWLGFAAREREIVVAAASRARSLAPVMGGIDNASGLWALLRREAPETVALAGGLGARAAARTWLDEVRRVQLAIDGDDLIAAGLSGPAVGRALEAAMAAALDGEAPDRESQLRVAVDSA